MCVFFSHKERQSSKRLRWLLPVKGDLIKHFCVNWFICIVFAEYEMKWKCMTWSVNKSHACIYFWPQIIFPPNNNQVAHTWAGTVMVTCACVWMSKNPENGKFDRVWVYLISSTELVLYLCKYSETSQV